MELVRIVHSSIVTGSYGQPRIILQDPHVWNADQTHSRGGGVHGLRGGSRKTWTKEGNPALFWPKEWLPMEPGFENVRIHSYGYDSDWGKGGASVLNVHDFGQALLGDIQNSPHIQRSVDVSANAHLVQYIGLPQQTPIVLIGHSMGGIVIKQAYILAKQDQNTQSLANRFYSIFFLATPHRGAGIAQFLNNLIQVSVLHGSKAYVKDIMPGSVAIQVINDAFRKICQNLQIWSFFEGAQTHLGFVHALIVEKDSAVLGLPGEHIQLLNADHRHVCKFDAVTDSNYLTLRNAFLSTINNSEQNLFASRRNDHRSQAKILSQYLSIPGLPEGDLDSVTDKQIGGSCQWITSSSDFLDWQEGLDSSLKFFWLSGKAATGKSVIAGHVIKYLERSNCNCSYYFFKRGDTKKSRISELLRSLAYQMAFVNLRVRRELLSMQSEGESFDKDDERVIWRTIFLARIFRTEMHQPHYWVIDALDECRGSSSLFQMLSKVEKRFPLRVFVTSRSLDSIERLFMQEKIPVFAKRITAESSLGDIRLFLQANTRFLPVDSEVACQELIDEILEKSNGCFLWVALVLKELEMTHSDEQIRKVLKSVPTGMDELYNHILDGMAKVPRNKELAKAILRWTVCVARPLTTEELKEALRLDVSETLPRLDKSVESVCGNLVHIDSQSRVQVVHQTVRTFLISGELESEFAINKAAEHSRLAEICLEYLLSDEMKSLRRYRKGNTARRPIKRSLFAEYATQYFSEHIARSSSSIDTQLVLLDRFFKTNVLTWIELIARGENLYFLYQTAKNLKVYLKRRAKYRSPLGKEVQAVEAWSDDLVHIIAAFGKCLLSSPASIHFLIPPVCPPGSVLHKSFKDYPRSVKVVGVSEQDWDDRLSCITFPEDQALSVACRDSRFAVGLSSGNIVLYDDATCQETGTLNHGQPVRFLEFANINTFLASSGRKIVKLWNAVTRTLIWTIDIRVVPLSLSFNENDSILMMATTSNHIARWNMSDGAALDICLFWDPDDEQQDYKRPPWQAQFSTELNILAIGYRQRPIALWDLEDMSFLGQVSKLTTSSPLEPRIAALVFNPNPEINLLAISYQDGELVIYDPWSQQQQASVNAGAQILAASPDGKTLAAENGCGTIQLYDFETLRLMYSITAEDYHIRALAFSSNSLRFFDIGGSHCNIWEPSVLVRRVELEDNYSEPCSDDAPNAAQLVSAKLWDDSLTITAIADHHYDDFVFCGRENGSVVVFDTKTGKAMQELYCQVKNIAVSLLEWNHQESVLASTDVSSRFTARKITREISGSWKTSEPLIDDRVDQAIRQILLSPNGKQLLVSTALSENLYSLDEKPIQHLARIDSASRQMPKKWINNPSDRTNLLQFDGPVVRIFSWNSLEEISAANGISLDIDDVELPLTELLSSSQGQSICARFSAPRCRRGSSQLRVWTASELHSGTGVVAFRADYGQLAAGIKAIVGVYKTSLLFLDHNGWICSVSIEGVGMEKSYTRHFFIPYGWHSSGDLIFRCSSKGAVVLARRDEIAVFHRGLDFEEKVALE
ncbi:hypothetical protein FGG08_006571 [Glutinoglossum americanum]|uniref:GPI inositol-deacylase n=1 Tax=Glutinoglossum americanum TaxID=1670608 RepID=A0A9P8L0T4_9PEZI|nr:hypothetical protein FGG08_006571 [Glutinoglossum americanum]